MRADWFRRYILPGFILKSVIIGGGYASGQEFLQYFLSFGPWGGLIAIGVATLAMGLVYAASLEFARVHHTFEYKGFFKQLLGPFWVVFEIAYVIMLFLVLSNIGAVFGNTLHNELNLPVLAGELGFLSAVAVVVFFGTAALERFLVFWSFILYVFYFAFVTLCLTKFGVASWQEFHTDHLVAPQSAALSGLAYAGYNISAMTATLFVANHLKRSSDALVGGLLGGPLAMLPAFLFYLAMVAFYPGILHGVLVPMTVLLDRLDLPLFRTLFLVVLLSALVGTGSAMVHSFNERIAESRRRSSRPTPGWMRATIAILVLSFSVIVADQIGLVGLVRNGYGMMAKVFIVIFMIPILTVGIWKIIESHEHGKLLHRGRPPS